MRSHAEALQWFGLLAAPLAWTAQLVLGFGSTLAACGDGGRSFAFSDWVLALTAAAAAVALAGEAAALLAWRATRRPGGRAEARVHFFADAALVANAIFLVAILLGGLTAVSLVPCRQA